VYVELYQAYDKLNKAHNLNQAYGKLTHDNNSNLTQAYSKFNQAQSNLKQAFSWLMYTYCINKLRVNFFPPNENLCDQKFKESSLIIAFFQTTFITKNKA